MTIINILLLLSVSNIIFFIKVMIIFFNLYNNDSKAYFMEF